MCGIVGWTTYGSDQHHDRSVLEAMTSTMACRGPDDSGTWMARHAALGHRRLAVLDPAGGRQPMTLDTPRGTLALTFSGEVYNFRELRSQLISLGHRFRTNSDTEVVLHGYAEWGEHVAEQLDGMFAFAVWDEGEQKLVMVRDRLGVKPLYYQSTHSGVLFGSEPKALLAHPSVAPLVDSDGLREIFAFTHAPNWTLWKGMRQVTPGTVVTVGRAGVRERVYWRLASTAHDDNRHESIDRVRDLLDRAVRRQLVSDVPLGVLLSGGLDSSAITGLAAEALAERGEKLRTFSVGFTGQEEQFEPDDLRATSDGPFVRDVVRQVRPEHHDIVLDSTELSDPSLRRRVITARDSPAGLGDMDLSLYLLFKAVRAHSTVVLSGEAADELFGGYRWFHRPEALQARTFPWLVQRGVMDRTRGIRADVLKALDVAAYSADQYAAATAKVERADGISDEEHAMRVMFHLNMTRHVRMLLDRKDRISMAVGLEVRVPFCDHRLVEYVYGAPWAVKSFDGREKSLLRHASAHVIPASVAGRTKAHYPSVQDASYARSLQEQAAELLLDPHHPVFDVADREWLQRATSLDPHAIPVQLRHDLDRILDLYHWFDLYSPRVVVD
ncbi:MULTISPECIES: asparagine synthase (glutamine-hydrolyzing) [unclassified Streptomyces]|uniref:asparagine synthase (glutamine-hydrolyzing) n=1 Tax=unclassified Streptomyces TaxID=2593676 RepID=UPI0022582741|nr:MULTISPECIES: asparagine synthase (glutamine-hydrolyzing) [unclassified Streptomyces]MCX4406098.1 asparagine synthase (glutamine-hydrolyzing) [Streptomyces sp. NBC_01764]MCX5189377.1 asparagine synthase (glutamine-hydrolyzing) [Streptomyces sp. NBC_00268]